MHQVPKAIAAEKTEKEKCECISKSVESSCDSPLEPLKRSVFRMILSACPYTHLWQVIKTSIQKRKFNATTRQGIFITLLGILCPLFWFALFTGATAKELKFHATHSAIVALMGVVMVIIGLRKKQA